MASLERFCSLSRHGTLLWIGFAAAAALLVVACSSRRQGWRRAGLGVLAIAMLLLAAAVAGRWLATDRPWYLPPIMNQFEAVTASALLAAAVGLTLELLWSVNFIALAAAIYAAIALLCGFFLGRSMGADADAANGILYTPLLALHVATILVGYALAAMTAVLSVVYLVCRAGAGEGAALSSGADLADPLPPDASAAAVVDRCNLICAQLACWLIAAGTMLGACWADVAWGRWWGWDPKETWALTTILVYVAVLMVRFVSSDRRRGLVTAAGCLLGCGVMLFNWIVVNYILPGLHSYA